MHYFHLILLDPKEIQDDLNGIVTSKMAPFSEEIKVAPYEAPCYCIGDVARAAATDALIKKFGTGEESHKDWLGLIITLNSERAKNGATPLTDDETHDIWTKLYYTPRYQIERQTFRAHKMRNKPDPECGFYLGPHWKAEIAAGRLAPEKYGKRYDDISGCGGTGKRMVTRNPQGHWDYWTIGGRWTGQLDGHDPTKDPENIETCHLCSGTGDRPGWVNYTIDGKPTTEPANRPLTVEQLQELHIERAFKDDWARQCNGCNGCKGLGKHARWPSHFKKHPGDIQMVSSLVGREDAIPHSLILPDGTWEERRDGFWTYADAKSLERKWSQRVAAIFKQFPDHVAVVVDYHN